MQLLSSRLLGISSRHSSSIPSWIRQGDDLPLPDGERFLRFEDFTVTNGPALSVYLVRSADGDVSSGYLDLGPLKGNKGNQNYQIPGDTDLSAYESVVIWCVPFGVTFATALLQ